MQGAIEIGWIDLAISLLMMGGVIILDRIMRTMLGKDLTIGTARVFIQLYIVGFILKWIFKVNSPWVVLTALAFMSIMAGYNAMKRAGEVSARNTLIATGIIVFGTIVSAGFACELVIKVNPWFDPQYVIPIGGMAMNGAMNGVSLGIANLRSSVRDNAERIECALSLGAKGTQAIHPLITEAGRRSLIPTVNSLMTAGIVQIPGMMTGQIIAGQAPTSAVKYQIIIYYMIAVATTVSVVFAMKVTARRYFTAAHQLKRIWNDDCQL